MKDLIDALQNIVPEYAKDIRLNVSSVMNSTGIDNENDAPYIALASAVASGNHKLVSLIDPFLSNEVDKKAAYVAASIMAQNNYWYSFIEAMGDLELTNMPAGLRMNALSNHGETELTKFEGYSLAASVIGKCKPCIKSHYKTLKDNGYTTEQLRNIARIAVTINAISKIISVN